MEERRGIVRVDFPAKSVIVVVDTSEKFYVETENVSPLGMGIKAPADMPLIIDKDVIVVAETMIMYATVSRQEKRADGSYILGVTARKFTPEVLEYLFTHIGEDYK